MKLTEQIDAAYKTLICHTRRHTRYLKQSRRRWLRRRAKNEIRCGSDVVDRESQYGGWAS